MKQIRLGIHLVENDKVLDEENMVYIKGFGVIVLGSLHG